MGQRVVQGTGNGRDAKFTVVLLYFTPLDVRSSLRLDLPTQRPAACSVQCRLCLHTRLIYGLLFNLLAPELFF